MAERVNWTPDEVAETVSSYFKMLKLELAGKSVNKSEENARLRARLTGRSKGAVEFKHQNISAVLLENGWIYIDGYKPMKNVQGDLRNEVERQLRLDSELDNLMMKSSNSMVGADDFDPELPELVEVPEVILGTAAWTPRITGIKRDYVFRDVRNRALGLAGELKVVEYERRRLLLSGREDLARRVEHVAATQGDGLGYDVLSFETSALERFIEVKTTLYSIETPFFVSSNEVAASDFYGNQFHLHRLFRFAKKSGMYSLNGSIRNTCYLAADSYVATPRNTSQS